MGEIIDAVYRGGVLHPVQPLRLQESQQVRIHVMPKSSSVQEDTAIAALVAAGILTPPAHRLRATVKSDRQRHRLAQELGSVPGKPLSQIIIEERASL